MERIFRFMTNLIKSQSISDALVESGGGMAKLAQLKEAKDLESKVWDAMRPDNQASTLANLSAYYQEHSDLINTIDLSVWKCGSVGQIYRGVLVYENERACFKIVHHGIEQKMAADVRLLSSVVSWLKCMGLRVGSIDAEISAMMKSELDMEQEARNQYAFSKIWSHVQWIKIPKIYKTLTCSNVLCSEYVEGMPLYKFIRASSKPEINMICFKVAYFVMISYIKHGIFYTDCHPGNFLVKNNTLVVLDFGAIKYFTKSQLRNIIDMYRQIINNDITGFRDAMIACEMISQDCPSDSVKKFFLFFQIQLRPFITRPSFQFTEEWFQESISYKDIVHWELPRHLIWFGKLLINMNQMFVACKATAPFYMIFEDGIGM